VALVAELDMAKSIPVPESAMVWGLPAALSVTVSVPVCEPAEAGSKNTLMVQPTPTARLVAQPLVVPKPALTRTLDRLKGASPLLVSVTF